jgi:hypothetical protein
LTLGEAVVRIAEQKRSPVNFPPAAAFFLKQYARWLLIFGVSLMKRVGSVSVRLVSNTGLKQL